MLTRFSAYCVAVTAVLTTANARADVALRIHTGNSTGSSSFNITFTDDASFTYIASTSQLGQIEELVGAETDCTEVSAGLYSCDMTAHEALTELPFQALAQRADEFI